MHQRFHFRAPFSASLHENLRAAGFSAPGYNQGAAHRDGSPYPRFPFPSSRVPDSPPPPSAPNRCQSVSIGGPIVRPQSPRSGSAFISGSTSVLCVSAWEPPVAGFGATGYSRAVPLKQHETETTDFTDEHGSSSDHPWQSVKSVVTLQPARSAMLLPRKAVPPRASTLSSRLSASFRPGSAFHLLDFRQPVPWHPTTSRSAPRRGLPRPPFLRSLRYLPSSVLRPLSAPPTSSLSPPPLPP